MFQGFFSKFVFNYNLTSLRGTLHEELFTYMILS